MYVVWYGLENHHNHEADTTFARTGQVGIGQPTYILDVEQLEDVIDTGTHLHVGGVVHQVTGEATVAHREEEQIGVVALEGVVLVSQCAPHAFYLEHLAPLQLLNQWQAVEELTVEVIGK